MPCLQNWIVKKLIATKKKSSSNDFWNNKWNGVGIIGFIALITVSKKEIKYETKTY